MKPLSVWVVHRPWAALTAAIAVVFAIHLLTLRIDPLIFQDEVQILDYGRTALDPGTNWATTWNVQQSIPVLTISYLSSALQELAYRASQESLMGPRISAVLGAVLAAYCLFGWLRARNTSAGLSLLLAVLFLLDPIFSDLYRQGRVDGLAMASVLGACWLLRLATARVAQGRSSRSPVFGAGMLTVLSPFLWATVPVLFPLIALEGYYLAKASWKTSSRIGSTLGVFVPGALGLAIAATLLAVPLAADLDAYWQGMKTSAAVQAHAAVIQNSILDLFLVHDPGLSLLLLVSILLCREIGLFLALVAAVLIIDRTMVYLPRILYLIPYLLAVVAAAWSYASAPGRHALPRKLLTWLLGFSVALGIAWVLILRPLAAFKMWPANDPTQVTAALEARVGAGPHRVLLEAWEAYYAGRALGWEMYQAGSPVRTAEYLEFARTMDFVIVLQHTTYRNIGRQGLIDAGFVLADEIAFDRAAPLRLPPPLSGFGFVGKGYPTIHVYQNTLRQQAR